MSNESLKSFKIGDRRPPTVAPGHRGPPPAKAAASAGSAAVASATGEAAADGEAANGMRFERLEEALDHEDPRDLGSRLAKMLTDLEVFAAAHPTARDRAAAKHARQAIERTIDLLDHLFKVREALALDSLEQNDQAAAAASPSPKKRPASPGAPGKGSPR